MLEGLSCFGSEEGWLCSVCWMRVLVLKQNSLLCLVHQQ